MIQAPTACDIDPHFTDGDQRDMPGREEFAPAGMTAETSLQRLKKGNARFASGNTIHPNLDSTRRIETFNGGQKPFVTVFTCSDSRVPPELIFDQGIGDMFVIRVAGHVCGLHEVATVELGVERLNTPLLLILGHSKCWAVTAVATGLQMHGNVLQLREYIGPAVAKAQSRNPVMHGTELVQAAIEENVWKSIEDIFSRSQVVRELTRSGRLSVVGAIYDTEGGHVKWLGAHPEQSGLLSVRDD
jgi:carbonic anhydrase